MNDSNQVLASRGKRLGGALLDSLIMMLIIFPVMFFAGVFKQTTQGEPMSIGQDIFFTLFGLAVFLGVNGVLLAKHGQTVGKKMVGTKIVDHETGQLISVWKVFGLRLLPMNLMAQVPFAGGFVSMADCFFIFRNDKRCLHDLIAGTKVVDINHIDPAEETTDEPDTASHS